jgi:hypothetical protein
MDNVLTMLPPFEQVLYTRFEALRLDRVVGTARARKMLTSEKDVHLFC